MARMSKKAAKEVADRANRVATALMDARLNPDLIRDISYVAGGNIELKIDIYEEIIRRREWKHVLSAKCSPNLYADIMEIINREE